MGDPSTLLALCLAGIACGAFGGGTVDATGPAGGDAATGDVATGGDATLDAGPADGGADASACRATGRPVVDVAYGQTAAFPFPVKRAAVTPSGDVFGVAQRACADGPIRSLVWDGDTVTLATSGNADSAIYVFREPGGPEFPATFVGTEPQATGACDGSVLIAANATDGGIDVLRFASGALGWSGGAAPPRLTGLGSLAATAATRAARQDGPAACARSSGLENAEHAGLTARSRPSSVAAHPAARTSEERSMTSLDPRKMNELFTKGTPQLLATQGVPV